MKNKFAQFWRYFIWTVGVLVNGIAQFMFMPSYLFADILIQVVGRSLGVLLISFLLLLPLELFKKDPLRKNLLPYIFVFISLISLVGSLG